MPAPSRPKATPRKSSARQASTVRQAKSADSLLTIQRSITGALFQPLTRDEDMQPDAAAVAEKFIKPNDRLTAFERLQIYNQQYWWRLLGSFAEDFRGLLAVLGESKFDRLAQAYLTAHGSRSWTLRDLGSQLVPFLDAHPELTRPHSALALDVARVEWARVLAFDDPERPVLDPKRIAGIPADQLHLRLQPYVNLLELQHPVDEFMRTLKRTEIAAVSNAVAATHTKRRSIVTVRKSRKPIYLAVHRVDFSVYYKRLDAEAYRLLVALREGASLEAACATAFAETKELPEQSAARLQEWFARWMEFGWFCR